MTARISAVTEMQAVVWGEAAGGGFALRPQSIPLPGPGEVRLRVAAAALNYSDLLLARGRYTLASPIAGIEAAGIIDAVGPDVTDWKVGDRVCALSDGGAQAEWLCARADHLLPWPERLDAVEAASLPEAMATIWSPSRITPCSAGLPGITRSICSEPLSILSSIPSPTKLPSIWE